jgi:hypothetical protein
MFFHVRKVEYPTISVRPRQPRGCDRRGENLLGRGIFGPWEQFRGLPFFRHHSYRFMPYPWRSLRPSVHKQQAILERSPANFNPAARRMGLGRGSCEMAYSLTIPSVFVRACPCPSITRFDRTGPETHIARPSLTPALIHKPLPSFLPGPIMRQRGRKERLSAHPMSVVPAAIATKDQQRPPRSLPPCRRNSSANPPRSNSA